MAIITILEESVALANTSIVVEWQDSKETRKRTTDAHGQINLKCDPGKKARFIVGTTEQPEKSSDFLLIEGNVKAELMEVLII